MRKSIVLIVVLLLALFACGKPSTAPKDRGDLPLRVNLAPALQHGFSVSQVRVTITKGSFSQQLSLQITGSSAEGVFEDLEIGTYAILVEVFDGNVLIARGTGTATVKPSQNTVVHITLQFEPGSLEVVVSWGLPYEECRRVLLVGNSYTYGNGGLNTHLQALLQAAHPEWTTTVSAVANGGYTLQNHYNDVNTIGMINSGNWDLVILQEQSSRPVNDPELFYQYATQLNQVISRAGALTGFFMTWAYRNNPAMYEPLRDAYNYIGAYLDAVVAPAGVAFYNAAHYPGAPNTYEGDNSHPNLSGTYLTACTMLASIWNINPIGNTYIPAGMRPDDAAILQNIAWNTVIERP